MKVINFMGPRKLCAAFSLSLILASLVSLAVQQLNWGLDFTGGTLVEVYYSETADLNAIRDTLANGGYEGATRKGRPCWRNCRRGSRVAWSCAASSSWGPRWGMSCASRAASPCCWPWGW